MSRTLLLCLCITALLGATLPASIYASGGGAVNNLTVSEGSTLPSGTTVAAGFTGTCACSAVINWNDGSPIDAATVVANGPNWDVQTSSTHTFGESGGHPYFVSFTDTVSNTNVSGTITINDAFVILTSQSTVFTEGASGGGWIANLGDGDPTATCADYSSITINWGDGSPNSAGVCSNASPPFKISANHTYAEEGIASITVTAFDVGGSNNSRVFTDPITDAALTVTSVPVSSSEGTALSGVSVASFTDADPAGTLTDYTASINWGDGTPASAGVISGTGPWSVAGSHTYVEEGNKSVTVTVNDATGNGSVTFTASVGDVGISFAPTGALSSTEGSATTVNLGTLTDTNASGAANDFTWNINWGDGSPSSSAVFTSLTSTTYSVTGSHTYLEEGSFNISGTITDIGGSSTVTAGHAMTVADANLTLTAATPTISEGQTFNGAIANLVDANPNATVGDFTTITINWGDGGTTVSGAAVSSGGGNFGITGSHTYSEEGNFIVRVNVTDTGGSTASLNFLRSTGDSILNVTTSALSPAEGVAFAGATVATFTDADPGGTLSDYTATIDWGDGTPTTAGVISGTGPFSVKGGHTYSDEALHTLSVTVVDAGGASAVNTNSVSVNDAALSATPGADLGTTEGIAQAVSLGTLQDLNLGATCDDFTITASWADGTADSTPACTSLGGGNFSLTDNHTSGDEGTFTVTVNISDVGGNTASFTLVNNSGDANLSMSAAGQASVEGSSATFNATLTDTNTLATCADFNTVFNWGDGSPTTTATCSGVGPFVVSANHTYAEKGSFTVAVSSVDVGGSSVGQNFIATVSDATLSVTAGSNLALGESVASGSVTVATFTDANAGAPLSDFTASINWGDGSPNSPGVISGTGPFTVQGNHTYLDAGSYTITVKVTDADGSVGTVTLSSVISEGTLAITGIAFNATAGTNWTGNVATATDSGGIESATDYTALIDWGDGSAKTAGSITPGSTNIVIDPGHTYASAGTYTVTVSFSEVSGGSVLASTATATVAPATVTPPPFTKGPSKPSFPMGLILLLLLGSIMVIVPVGLKLRK